MKFKNRVFSFIMAISLIFSYSPVYASDIAAESTTIKSTIAENDQITTLEADTEGYPYTTYYLNSGTSEESSLNTPNFYTGQLFKVFVSSVEVRASILGYDTGRVLKRVGDEYVELQEGDPVQDIYIEYLMNYKLDYGDGIVVDMSTRDKTFENIYDDILDNVKEHFKDSSSSGSYKLLKDTSTSGHNYGMVELQKNDSIQNVYVEFVEEPPIAAEESYTISIGNGAYSLDFSTSDSTFENVYDSVMSEIENYINTNFDNVKSFKVLTEDGTELQKTDPIQNVQVEITRECVIEFGNGISITKETTDSTFENIYDELMSEINNYISENFTGIESFKVLTEDGTELQRTDTIQDITVEIPNLERNFTIYFEYENSVVSSIDKTTTDPTFENMYNDLYDEIYDHAYDLYGNDLSSIDIYNSSDTYLDPTDSIQNLYVIIYINTTLEPTPSYDITVQKEWVVPKSNIRIYLRDKEGFAFTDFEYLVIADSSGKELERIYRYDENAKGSLIISKEAYSADTDFIITIYNSDDIELGTKIVEGYDLKANIPSSIQYDLYHTLTSYSVKTGWLYSYNNWEDSCSVNDNPSSLWIREVTEGNWETVISRTQNPTSYTFTIKNTIKLDPSIIVIELPPQDHFPETGNHGLPIAVIPVFMITSIIITTTYVVKKKNK